MCAYGRGLERLLAHTYGEGSLTWLGRNGETASTSWSWGGNGMRRVHGEATECVVFIRTAWTEQAMETRPGVPQNEGNGLVFNRPRSKRDPVHREGSGVSQNGRNGPPTVETGVLLFRRGVEYRKMEEADLCWNATVETGVLLIGRGVAYRKTDETDLLRSKRVSCSSGGVWRTTKRDSTGYCSSAPSTPSSFHELLFIHHRPPPASTYDCSSTGSCSSSLHHALLHRLLFNQPSPQAPVQPPLHELLFIQPSPVYCSSSPPRGRPVHPALHGVLFIQPQPARL